MIGPFKRVGIAQSMPTLSTNPVSLAVNSVLGKWGFGFCNWGLTFGLGLGDGLCNSTTRGTFSCPIFEQNILLEIS